MEIPLPAPRRVAIGVHPSMPDATQEAAKIERFLKEQGVEQVIRARLSAESFQASLTDGEFDLLIALGGDGTMLRAGHLCGPLGIPVLGINLGRFGFLMEVKRHDWAEMLPRLFDSRYRLENRMMLNATHLRKDKPIGSWPVINEVVVCRGQFVRPVRLCALADGYRVANFVADGLIVATPTGSTAYALAAGGPIMPPELRNILIVAVAPHLSVEQAVILAEGSVVDVSAESTHQVVMSVDGQPSMVVQNGDTVRVQANDYDVQFVRFHNRGYFYKNLTEYMEQNPVAKEI
jgi:NAD+ kinase